MAKEKKVEKKAKAEKVEKTAAPEFKYGVAELAEKLGLEAATVRVRLRNANIEKAGKSYGWNTKAELDEVVAELKADKPAKPAKKAKEEVAEKPSKKDKKAKAAKKAKKAKDEDDDD